jgi:hypothetical protein
MWQPMSITVALFACGSTAGPMEPRTYALGDIAINAGQEITDSCVQITLDNDTTLDINKVELVTGPGFHHSNWTYVPVDMFPGGDGVFRCADRQFDEAVAAIAGGVLFAQSTQSQHDIQAFPAGAALEIPAHSKLVAAIHLLNASDQALHLSPTITLTPIADVTTRLVGMAFEDHALALPAGQRSKFVADCDLQTPWDVHRGETASDHPDFHIYYALAHYHALGTGMAIDGVADDGSATTIYSTAAAIGDSLGATLDPPFAMTGFTHLRFSCDYNNTTGATVLWGNGGAEMCVFLAFTDSRFVWAGGVLDNTPGTPVDVDGVMTFTRQCGVIATDASGT